MKKIIFSLLAVFVLTACSDDDPVYIKENGVEWNNIRLQVNGSDWKLKGSSNAAGSYYYYDFQIPELNRNIFNDGLVLMYIESDLDFTDVKQIMPFIIYNEGNPGYFWTETFDYDYEPGGVRICCKYSDFQTGNRSPGTEVFHLVLLY